MFTKVSRMTPEDKEAINYFLDQIAGIIARNNSDGEELIFSDISEQLFGDLTGYSEEVSVLGQMTPKLNN